MEKPIIGMVSPRTTKEDKPFDNYTKFINTYPKRIIEAGGIPIGLIFPDGKFEIKQADLCDGFILQGGPIIESYQINMIKYAIDKKKPILGICLGMQTMAGYNWIFNELGNALTYKEIENFFKPEYEEYFLEKKEGHNNLDPFYLSQIEKSKHNIILDKDSRIYEIYKTNVISEPSLHGFMVKEKALDKSKIFKVTGKSEDGTIEIIEGLNPDHFMIGTQFHPELEKQNNSLFKKLVKEAKKR